MNLQIFSEKADGETPEAVKNAWITKVAADALHIQLVAGTVIDDMLRIQVTNDYKPSRRPRFKRIGLDEGDIEQ
ncbi:hypothetical protein LTR66_016623, partial [Elasticomyces elasticus]